MSEPITMGRTKFKGARIPEPIATAAENVAKSQFIKFNQFIVQAVRNELERLGKLPQPKQNKHK